MTWKISIFPPCREHAVRTRTARDRSVLFRAPKNKGKVESGWLKVVQNGWSFPLSTAPEVHRSATQPLAGYGGPRCRGKRSTQRCFGCCKISINPSGEPSGSSNRSSKSAIVSTGFWGWLRGFSRILLEGFPPSNGSLFYVVFDVLVRCLIRCYVYCSGLLLDRETLARICQLLCNSVCLCFFAVVVSVMLTSIHSRVPFWDEFS